MTATLQVVDGEGVFNKEKVDAYMRDETIEHCGVDYQIVAITGPQSSGKSTLMNAVFGTSFEEMDAMSGRQQTTHGIWMARSAKVDHPATLVMDLEGSDGRERGEDDTSFERQSALFALAVSDVLLVNIWAKDVGREAGSGKPLLKTIFQVNLKLFTPAPNKRRTVLLFVFRDRTRTPLERLVETWEADLQRMWASITKPPKLEAYSFNDFFEVQYAALPNFEDREDEFRSESKQLRKRFSTAGNGDGSLVRVSPEKLPGQALALSLCKVWEVIKSQKDLSLPAHKVMVANIRCSEIMAEQLQAISQDQAWQDLAAAAQEGLVPEFGPRVAGLLESCCAGYDEEARYFESGVQRERRGELIARLAALVRPALLAQLSHLRAASLERFTAGLGAGGAAADGAEGAQEQTFAARAARSKEAALASFQQSVAGLAVPELELDSAAEVAQLGQQIDAEIQRLISEKIAEVMRTAAEQLHDDMAGPAIAYFDAPPPDLWLRLGKLQGAAASAAVKSVSKALEGYGLAVERLQKLGEELRAEASSRIEAHAREAANTALSRMRDRFTEVFSRDEHGMPRSWAPATPILVITEQARAAAARLLGQLAVLRLQSPQAAKEDWVERAVRGLSGGPDPDSASSTADSSGATDGGFEDFDIMAASEWPGIPAARVLLSPAKCRTLWRSFLSDTNYTVQQAMATQEANRAASSRMPPLWAVAAIIFLGFNEFLTVLYNPLLLLLGIAGLLFGKTVYEELEVDAELERGMLPGLLAISGKLGPVLRAVSWRTVESVLSLATQQPESPQRRGGSPTQRGSPAGGRSSARSAATSPPAGLRRRFDPEGTDSSQGGVELTATKKANGPAAEHVKAR